MTTSYNQRYTTSTTYNQRVGDFTNIYDLSDVTWALIFDVASIQIQVLWEFYEKPTDYSLRITP